MSQGGGLRHSVHPAAHPLPLLSLLCYFKHTNSQGFVGSGKDMGSELLDLPENLSFAVHYLCDLEQIANPLWASVSSTQNRGVVRIEWG